jgi:hypothetical protein
MTPAKVSNHTGAHQRRESPRAQFHLPKPRASLPTHSRSPTPRRTHAAQACKSSGAPPTQTTRQAHLGAATNSLNRACSRDGPQQRSLSRAQSSPENRHRQGPLPRSPYVTTTCCQEVPQSYKPSCQTRPGPGLRRGRAPREARPGGPLAQIRSGFSNQERGCALTASGPKFV